MKKGKKKGSTDLFKLIKSLSGAEKRYFTIFSKQHIIGETNNYIKLFDAIAGQIEYDEDELPKQFSREKFVKQLPRVKNYLYTMLMDALSRYYAERNVKSNIRNTLEKADILFIKGLYDQCEKLVVKARKLAEDNESHLQMIEIYSFESQLASKQFYRKKSKQDILDIFSQITDTQDKIKGYNDYVIIISQLHWYSIKHLTIKNDRNLIEVNKLFKSLNELHHKRKKPLSDTTILLYYTAANFYFDLIGDSASAYKYRCFLVKFLGESVNYIKKNPASYIYNLHNFLQIAIICQPYQPGV